MNYKPNFIRELKRKEQIKLKEKPISRGIKEFKGWSFPNPRNKWGND